jgi:transcriptional regulator with XRE-family HTH domain
MADTKLQLLRQAAKLVGNEELAKRLNVPLTLLEAWLRGLATMPDRKLLTLADLLDKLGDAEK